MVLRPSLCVKIGWPLQNKFNLISWHQIFTECLLCFRTWVHGGEQNRHSSCPYGCHWLLITVIAIDYKLRKSIPSFKWMWSFKARWSKSMLQDTLVSKLFFFQSVFLASFLLESLLPSYLHGTVLSPAGASTGSYESEKKWVEKPFTKIWLYKFPSIFILDVESCANVMLDQTLLV